MSSLSYATGRRKESISRVYLNKGSGKITVNSKKIEDFFCRETSIMIIKQPLELLGMTDQFDINVFTSGGGSTGQAGAIRLAIARALAKMDEQLRPDLKKAGYLTRDARSVERKKLGFRKARKKEQYSKR